MSVDACIFAKKAKRYFYFDRLKNFKNVLCQVASPEYRAIMDRYNHVDEGTVLLSKAEVLLASRENSDRIDAERRAWRSEWRNENEALFEAEVMSDVENICFWNGKIEAFAASKDDDEVFFVLRDDRDEYHDAVESGEYEEEGGAE